MRFKFLTILILLTVLLVGCGQATTSVIVTSPDITTRDVTELLRTATLPTTSSKLSISDYLEDHTPAKLSPSTTTGSTTTPSNTIPRPPTSILTPFTWTPPLMTTTDKILFIEILSVTSPVKHGRNATLKAKATPNTICGIEVYYRSGEGEAAGLHAQRSDDEGMVQWTWKVGTNTTPGTYKITVTAYDIGSSLTAVTDLIYFTVN